MPDPYLDFIRRDLGSHFLPTIKITPQTLNVTSAPIRLHWEPTSKIYR